MKVEFDIPEDLPSGILALLPINEPSPVAYFNLYETGDVWAKIKGCDECILEKSSKCCGSCPLVSEKGCFLHFDSGGANKPFSCIVQPLPNHHRQRCSLEYKCISGKFKGLVHRAQDPRDVMIDKYGNTTKVDL